MEFLLATNQEVLLSKEPVNRAVVGNGTIILKGYANLSLDLDWNANVSTQNVIEKLKFKLLSSNKTEIATDRWIRRRGPPEKNEASFNWLTAVHVGLQCNDQPHLGENRHFIVLDQHPYPLLESTDPLVELGVDPCGVVDWTLKPLQEAANSLNYDIKLKVSLELHSTTKSKKSSSTGHITAKFQTFESTLKEFRRVDTKEPGVRLLAFLSPKESSQIWKGMISVTAVLYPTEDFVAETTKERHINQSIDMFSLILTQYEECDDVKVAMKLYAFSKKLQMKAISVWKMYSKEMLQSATYKKMLLQDEEATKELSKLAFPENDI